MDGRASEELLTHRGLRDESSQVLFSPGAFSRRHPKTKGGAGPVQARIPLVQLARNHALRRYDHGTTLEKEVGNTELNSSRIRHPARLSSLEQSAAHIGQLLSTWE